MGGGAFPFPVRLIIAPGADVAKTADAPEASAVVEVAAGVGEGSEWAWGSTEVDWSCTG